MKPFRIMIIDDDSQIRQFLRRALEKSGYEVVEAADGDQGLRQFREDPCDIVITDIIMPVKDGWETIVELRKEFPHVNTIAISGGAKIGPFTYLTTAKRLGAQRILRKPIQVKELLTAVRDLTAFPGELPEARTTPRTRPVEKKLILVVDPDADHSWTLCKGLADAGHSVTQTAKADHALEIIRDQVYGVAIVDVMEARVGNTDLFQVLRGSWNPPLIVAMADFHALSVERSLVERGVDHFLGKPIDLQYLLTVISPPPEFSGTLAGIDLLDYLHFMLLTGKKTIVEVTSLSGHSCRLYLTSGRIVHAVSDAFQGEAAFFQCIEFRGGTLANLPWSEPDRVSIDKPGEWLLFEAARRKDESG